MFHILCWIQKIHNFGGYFVILLSHKKNKANLPNFRSNFKVSVSFHDSVFGNDSKDPRCAEWDGNISACSLHFCGNFSLVNAGK